MNSFATITPTRGDRPELFAYCLTQLDKINATSKYIISYPPTSESFDLVPRIRQGVEMAKADGIDFVYIIEDDDYYSKDYFTTLDCTGYDFVGFETTTYYNLKNKTYQTFDHPNRSSLFCTGFRISALEGFNWPNDEWQFLDIRLWEFANRYDKKIKLINDNPTLGIKHGIGKCGGKGHKMMLKNSDNDLSYLRSRVDNEAFEFYSDLMKRI